MTGEERAHAHTRFVQKIPEMRAQSSSPSLTLCVVSVTLQPVSYTSHFGLSRSDVPFSFYNQFCDHVVVLLCSIWNL
jgi:hypothetical protein